MIPPLPHLSDYDISEQNGFLPAELPLERLHDPYYEHWEVLVDSLPDLIDRKAIRPAIDRLPELSTHRLVTEGEWRRAYVVLGFLAHAYVWGGEYPKDRLPGAISIPWLRTAEHFDIPPVATYAAVCLWNFRPRDSMLPIDHLDNLETLCSFTGSVDEAWFYLVSVAIEARGGPTIPLMLSALAAARENDSHTVAGSLAVLAERIGDLGHLLERMPEQCAPEAFYYRIRPMLAGSKNMGDAGLPQGVIYEAADGSARYRQYSGGSNAQSSLIQFFDIVLGVAHRPTGVKRDANAEQQEGVAPPQKHNFIEEMRSYMPGAHRRFLEHLLGCGSVRDYVDAHRADQFLVDAYDECLRALSSFRDLHMRIVSRYIVVQSTKANRPRQLNVEAPLGRPRRASVTAADTTQRMTPPTTAFVGLARGEAAKQGLVGTGGTRLIPFLKQSRDETMEPASAAAAWSRKDLSISSADSFRIRHTPRARSPVKGVAPAAAAALVAGAPPANVWGAERFRGARACRVNELEDPPPTRVGVGMAGDWDWDSVEGGGLCCY